MASARVCAAMESVRDFTPKEKRDLVILLVESMEEANRHDEAGAAPRPAANETSAADDPLWGVFGALKDWHTLREDIYGARRSSTRVYEF